MPASPANAATDRGLLLPAAVVAALALCLTLFSLTVLDPFKYVAAQHLAGGGGARQLPWLFLGGLSAPAWTLLLAILAAAAALVGLEIRGPRPSRAISDAAPAARLLILASLLLWVGHAYLTPGMLVVGDANAHVARIAHVADALTAGRTVFWNNYWYGGTPVLQFTGPIFFWLGGGLAYLVGDADLAAKGLLFACHLLSGALAYGFLRAIGLGRLAATVGAVLYAGSYAHLYLTYFRASLPQALSFALVPALFWLAWRVIRERRILTWSWLGLCLLFVASLANHQPTALFSGLLVGLFCLAAFFGALCSWRRLVPLGLCAAAALILAAPFVVPIFAERSWVVAGEAPTGLSLIWPDLATWRTFVTWRAVERLERYNAYLGLSAVGLALAGIGSLAWRRQDPQKWYLVAIFSFLLLVAVALRIEYVRPLVFLVFLVAVLAALAAERLAGRGRRWTSLLLAAVLLDLTSTAILPLARTDKEHFADGARALASAFPERRIVPVEGVAPFDIPIGPNGGILARFPVQKLDGPHNITVPLTHNYLVTILKLAEADLNRSRALAPSTRRLLCLCNVAALVRLTPERTGLSDALPDATPLPGLGGVLALECPGPVLASATLTPLAPPPGLDQPTLWRVLEPTDDPADPSHRIARFLAELTAATGGAAAGPVVPALPVRDPSAAGPPPAGPPLGKMRVVDYRVQSDRVRATLDSDGTGFARLAHPWYPALRTTRNGEAVATLQDPMGFLVVPIVAGENRIEIVPLLTDLRRYTLWFSLVGIGLLTLLVALAQRRAANISA